MAHLYTAFEDHVLYGRQDCGGRISAPGTGSSHELRGEYDASRFCSKLNF